MRRNASNLKKIVYHKPKGVNGVSRGQCSEVNGPYNYFFLKIRAFQGFSKIHQPLYRILLSFRNILLNFLYHFY